jgi:hypothetical protein
MDTDQIELHKHLRGLEFLKGWIVGPPIPGREEYGIIVPGKFCPHGHAQIRLLNVQPDYTQEAEPRPCFVMNYKCPLCLQSEKLFSQRHCPGCQGERVRETGRHVTKQDWKYINWLVDYECPDCGERFQVQSAGLIQHQDIGGNK